MKLKHAYLLVMLMLAGGCGGGGGGGGSTAPPTSPPPPPPDPSSPLSITASNVQAVISTVLGAANDTLQQAHAAGHLAAEIIEQGTPSGLAICSDTGKYSGQLTDNGDGLYSAGDTLTIDFGTCTSGSIVATPQSSGELIVTTLGLTGSGEFQVAGDYAITEVADSGMEIAYALTARGESVVARSNDTGAGLAIGNNVFTDLMFRFDTEGVGQNSSYLIQFEAAVESSQLGGAFRCTTESLYYALRNREPVNGTMSCTGSGAAVGRQYTDSQTTNVIEYSANGVAPFDTVGAFSLPEVLDDFLFGAFEGQLLDFPFELPQLPSTQVVLTTSALAGNRAEDTVYAITTASDAQYPNSLVAVSSATGSVVDALPFTEEPVALGLSADGTIAYVGFRADRMIRKIDLASLTELVAIDLGTSNDGPRYAKDIAVSPESPDDFVVAISIETTHSNKFEGTAMYRGTVKQSRTLSSFEHVSLVEFSSRGDTLFGGNDFSTGWEIFVVDVLADGLQIRQALDDFVGIEYPFAVENDVIYTVDGNRVAPEAENALGEYLDRYELHRFRRAVLPDAANNRVYFYNTVLETYEQDTFLPVSAYVIDDTTPAHSMVHTAGNRLTLATESRVHFIDKESITDFGAFPCTPELLEDVINEASYPVLKCFFHDALYSDGRNRIYATLQGLQGQTGNSIVEINPQSLVVERRLFIGSKPNYLAISGDGSALFVGVEGSAEIARVDTDSFTVTNRTSMAVDSLDGPVRPGDMEVLPGSNEDVVVSLRNRQFTVEYRAIALYRNGIEAPVIVGGPTTPNAREIELSPAGDRVFGLDTETTAFDFTTSDLDSSGVFNITPQLEAGAFFAQFELAYGDLYLSTGEVIDTNTLSLAEPFAIGLYEERNRLVEPATEAGSTYFYFRDNAAGREMTLARFANGSRAPGGTVDLPRFDFGFGNELQLEQIGPDRLMLLTEDRLFIIDGSRFD